MTISEINTNKDRRIAEIKAETARQMADSKAKHESKMDIIQKMRAAALPGNLSELKLLQDALAKV